MPQRKRHTQQKLAALMGVSKTTVHGGIVDLTIFVHCNSLNLTEICPSQRGEQFKVPC